MPKNPIVLVHGLLGFAELKLAGSYLPPIHYWHGIKEALIERGCDVITATLPPSSSIEHRAASLSKQLAEYARQSGTEGRRTLNIVAHSMGGLDARYMISRMQPKELHVNALVTVATPHHGSIYADYLLNGIGPNYLPRVYNAWTRTTGWETGAFQQLTRKYMENEFNPITPNDPDVSYYSYGAELIKKPPLLSPFRHSFKTISRLDGPNDGLVSVESSKWGEYKGTLEGVSHLDLINWTNRLRWAIRRWMGEKQPFNAISFYLDIAKMLDDEGH